MPSPSALPTEVRYIKNGPGSCWWRAALSSAQIHAGWAGVPDSLIEARDIPIVDIWE